MSKLAWMRHRSELRLIFGLLAVTGGTAGSAHAQCPAPLPEPVTPAPCSTTLAFPTQLSENTTGAAVANFVGSPDRRYRGLGSRAVVFDFDTVAIVDGPGADFSVYESDVAGVEFHLVNVEVSADGQTFVDVKASEGTLVRIPGDERNRGGIYGRSYDLAVAGLGSARFVRLSGPGTGGVPAPDEGFDLDAIGAVNYTTDVDGDGLTVCQEASYGTDPHQADTDGDGIADTAELNCGTDPLDADTDADGVPDGADVCFGHDDQQDADGDGVPDACDVCIGSDATGDSDADGVCDDADACAGNDASGDDDHDATCNDTDACPLDPENDGDGDGTCGDVDTCVGNDATGDDDEDQVCNDRDLCRGNDASGDTDSDSICDSDDNCPIDENADQADSDGDGIGNRCEHDDDVDGVLDDVDNCRATYNPGQQDLDGDGDGDACDEDDDGDGVADSQDNCPFHANASQNDVDHDGHGDLCDGDDDADGIGDDLDACLGTEVGALIDEHGCSGAQLVTQQCGNASDYRRRGVYVACVMLHSTLALRKGLVTEAERALMIRNATRELCSPFRWFKRVVKRHHHGRRR